MLEQASLIRVCIAITGGLLKEGLGWGQSLHLFPSEAWSSQRPLDTPVHLEGVPSCWAPAQCTAVAHSLPPPALVAVSVLSFKELGFL